MTTPRANFTTEIFHNIIFAIGGFSAAGKLAYPLIESYNVKDDTWLPVKLTKSPVSKLAGHASSFNPEDNSILIFGGGDG